MMSATTLHNPVVVAGVLRKLEPASAAYVARLLRWHLTRTAADDDLVHFAEMFTRASRECVDSRFAECLRCLGELDKDASIPEALKRHESVQKLCEMASVQGARGITEHARSYVNGQFVMTLSTHS
jgi:hypothetical protein